MFVALLPHAWLLSLQRPSDNRSWSTLNLYNGRLVMSHVLPKAVYRLWKALLNYFSIIIIFTCNFSSVFVFVQTYKLTQFGPFLKSWQKKSLSKCTPASCPISPSFAVKLSQELCKYSGLWLVVHR